MQVVTDCMEERSMSISRKGVVTGTPIMQLYGKHCEIHTVLLPSAPAVQAEGVLALQVRRQRCRGKRREEGREEAHPARVEGTHVRLLEAADLQLGGLVLRVHCARERPPVEVAPLKRWMH